ncbi:hypothetical protein [Streptococcus pseudoporcinus]|nr:hypothetical protein [Streptococcus pseudoporcinus]
MKKIKAIQKGTSIFKDRGAFLKQNKKEVVERIILVDKVTFLPLLMR